MSGPPRPATLDWDGVPGRRGYRWVAQRPRALLLLQHGYAEHALRYLDHYHRLIPHLVALGISVHAIDLQGHGGSPGLRGSVDVDRAVEEHRVARRALAGSALPLLLFGHSLGGLITAASVARDPTGVAAVVLSSPALFNRSNAALRGLARLLAVTLPRLPVRRPQPATGLSRLDAEVAAFRRDPLIHRGWIPARVAASVLSVQRELWRASAAWHTPLLIVHGSADCFTDHRGSARFVALAGAAEGQFHHVPGGRHELLNDEGRDATRAMILNWLEARIDNCSAMRR